MAPERETADEVDGRIARRERNRDAVVDAIMLLVESGELEPNIAQVAEVAGVSERSIFRHFESRDALVAAVIERQLEMVRGLLHPIPPDGPVGQRARALVAERARLYEAITPMRRVALRVAERSEQVADKLAEARLWGRTELEQVFAPELDELGPAERRDLVAGLSTVASWEAWNVLRAHEGCSVSRARAITERLLLRTL